jgi:hypothetical protein
MKTGKINYERFGISINGYLSEKHFTGEAEVKQPDGTFVSSSGEHPRIDKIGDVLISFEDYLSNESNDKRRN